MGGRTFICGTPDRCEKHGYELHGYPCHDCHLEWERAYPRTAAAITEFAGGRGSVAKIRRAEKADQAALVAADFVARGADHA
jgi:hypothetical protein